MGSEEQGSLIVVRSDPARASCAKVDPFCGHTMRHNDESLERPTQVPTRTHLVEHPARDVSPPAGGNSSTFLFVWQAVPAGRSGSRRSTLLHSAEYGAIAPDAAHDHPRTPNQHN